MGQRARARPASTEPGARRSRSLGELGRVTIVLAVTAVVFFPALHNQFVNWDDDVYVVESTVIEDLSPENVGAFFTRFHHGLYQPLTLLSLAVDHAIGGSEPFTYHLVNVLLHLVNTALVFALVWMLARRSSVAFVAALVFGVHTLHVESVAWVTERKDVLHALFFLASAIAYVRCVESGRGRSYLLALLLFLLALLAKAQAVSLTLTLVVLDFWLGRPFGAEGVDREAALPRPVPGLREPGARGAGVGRTPRWPPSRTRSDGRASSRWAWGCSWSTSS